ncbi:MAG TPA: heat-inducible transcriptional repressor HrcA [Myxococcaceae bacterium]|nr:heat-inducible transcriptional repressor HrcA [Myxococcaceae bacterium]
MEDLNERARAVLHAVIREYVASGDPVGSQQLARTQFDVSSATLRNVMSDLEALGYLEKPHTSAGRVPTGRAYRFYVDTLMQLRQPPPRDRELIQRGIPSGAGLEESLQEASRVLHFVTRHACVVVSPRPSAGVFHRIEFVRLRDARVLAILVGTDGQVLNKPLTLDVQMSEAELVQASNYLSELLHEVPFEGLRDRIQAELAQEQALYDELQARALRLGFLATDLHPPGRVHIEGTGSFLEAPEFADVERMRVLFRALDEKSKLLALLDRVQQAGAMQIFIGNESEFSSAGDLTVVASPYGSEERPLGTVGVIGPTRMNYSRVIPLVQFTAQTLRAVLEQG